MNAGCIKIWLAAAAAAGFFLFLGTGRPAAEDYRQLAAQLAEGARARGLTRLAVQEFSAGEGATAREAKAAGLKLSEELFRLNEAGVMDAALLERLGERGRRWQQALLKGGLYADGDGRTLVLKLIDARTGRTLLAAQARLDTGPAIPADLRDAPAAPVPPCEARAARLQEAEAAAVELKARYWAARLRDPSYSPQGRETLPGAEYGDYSVRQEFYLRLNEHYESDAPVALSAAELERVLALREGEASFAAACPKGRTAIVNAR